MKQKQKWGSGIHDSNSTAVQNYATNDSWLNTGIRSVLVRQEEFKVLGPGQQQQQAGPNALHQPSWPSFMQGLSFRSQVNTSGSVTKYLSNLELRVDHVNGAVIPPDRYEARFRIGRGNRLVMDRIPIYTKQGRCPEDPSKAPSIVQSSSGISTVSSSGTSGVGGGSTSVIPGTTESEPFVCIYPTSLYSRYPSNLYNAYSTKPVVATTALPKGPPHKTGPHKGNWKTKMKLEAIAAAKALASPPPPPAVAVAATAVDPLPSSDMAQQNEPSSMATASAAAIATTTVKKHRQLPEVPLSNMKLIHFSQNRNRQAIIAATGQALSTASGPKSVAQIAKGAKKMACLPKVPPFIPIPRLLLNADKVQRLQHILGQSDSEDEKEPAVTKKARTTKP